ncbi:energy transducer TonB [Mucilaginibacter sp. BJC16-A38]|uniref:energy transducer TonB n=1 Tax=Mucilaginibacter phenanthrenivorans TaxID=1234842 RepID=UPI0021579B32|nr:energy transducer TonB [Mucilaginibacter phenanthrenivorans]MCR8558334.1 energy transducer TonB [Mucilaginibacter phenanthrenivorans]
MKGIFLIVLCLSAFAAKAQNTDTTANKKDSSKFVRVEVMPEFPGGIIKLMEYFRKNEKARGNEGTVRISFVVERDGTLSNIKIVNGLSDSADKEAIRLITQSPKWIPGMQGGRSVRVNYAIPIYFPAK